MGKGIAIAGANGSGKTTLGKQLAAMLGYTHLDIEAYSFYASEIPYQTPRPWEEARRLLYADMKKHSRFILTAVNCNLDNAINEMYHCVIYIKAPLATRLQRVKQRSFDKFGSRVRKGGDMYEQEQAFFAFVASRTMDQTEAWLQSVKCPVIELDGTKPAERNAELVKDNILRLLGA